MQLHDKAQKALDKIRAHAPLLFITGKAGTGKSTFINHLRNTYDRLAVVAPTGIAALNAQGVTMHSLFKIPPRTLDPHFVRPKLVQEVGAIRKLVIDEVSMVRADVLDFIDTSLQLNFGNTLPFGGVQIILVGDNHQLPPVIVDAEKPFFQEHYTSGWWFDARVVQQTGIEVVEFDKIFRQSDPLFIDILNHLRDGTGLRDVTRALNEMCCAPAKKGDPHIVLTSTKSIATSINYGRLEQLETPLKTYVGEKEGKFEIPDEMLPSPLNLDLKVGAKVMVTKNIESGAVNGTLAIVEDLQSHVIICRDIKTDLKFPVHIATWEQYNYKWDKASKRLDTRVIGSYKQFPLQHGWAITIHKSQGLTLDYVRVDLGNGAFAPGQAYVALSRCRTLEGLKLSRPILPADVFCDKRVKEVFG